MLTNKSNIVCILQLLKEYSDEEHILPMREIISKMKSIYGMMVDRRTVYGAIETLNFLGYDISCFDENNIGYYMRSRNLELSEVKLLMDSVYSSSFISPKQTADLIGKLQKDLSIHQRKKYKNLKVMKANKKTINKEVFYNIEMLDEAISKKVKIKFDYLEYDLNKNLIPRRNEKYLVNAYQMVCANEHYYLVCNYDKYDNLSHYRIDFIKNIEILKEPVKPLPNDFDLTEFSNNLIYMFGGNAETVKMICENEVLDDVIAKFGSDIKLSKFDDAHFKATISISPYGIKFWALQYIRYCEVISPAWLRDEIVDIIRNNKYNA